MLERFIEFMNQPAPPGMAMIGVGTIGILMGLFVIFFTGTRKD